MKKSNYNELMRAARKRIARMDKTDGGPISENPLDLALRTAMMAIKAGFSEGTYDAIADAQVMLQQIEWRYRPADSKGKNHLDKSGGYYLLED